MKEEINELNTLPKKKFYISKKLYKQIFPGNLFISF
jgi:hypothetical protein